MSILAQATNRNHNTAPSKNNVSPEILIPRVMVIFSAAALCLIGLLMVFSAGSIPGIDQYNDSTHYLKVQLGAAVLGAIACILLGRVEYHRFARTLLYGYFAICILLLLATPLMGSTQYGAQRWIRFGPVGIQASEFAKIALVLMACKFVSMYQEREIAGMKCLKLIVVFVVFPLAFLFFTQSDLGTTMICFVGILAVLWVAEMPGRVFGGVFLSIAGFGAFAIAIAPYRLERLKFWETEANSSGATYQLDNSLSAFSQGGLFGTGIGSSAQKYGNLPEAQTDFVFSVLGEEMGFIGAMLVVCLFLILLIGGLRMAMHAPDLFGRCICASMVTMLVFQAFLNIACVIGMAPTTGKPLPFLSYGGSSMLASLMIVGVMLSVSYHSDTHQKRRDDLRLVQSDAGYSRHRRRQTERKGGFDSPGRHRMEEASASRRSNVMAGSGSRSRSRSGGSSPIERYSAPQLRLVTSNRSYSGRRG